MMECKDVMTAIFTLMSMFMISKYYSSTEPLDFRIATVLFTQLITNGDALKMYRFCRRLTFTKCIFLSMRIDLDLFVCVIFMTFLFSMFFFRCSAT